MTLLALLRWASDVLTWVHKLLERACLAVVNVTVPGAPADTARPYAVVPVGVLLRELMPIFAMRLRSSIFGMRLHSLSERFSETRIESLLSACRPTAIPWFVVAVVVDSIQRVLIGRARTHVPFEILKPKTAWTDYAPSFTHLYASPTIVLVVGAVGVRATLNHVGPSPVKAFFFIMFHSNCDCNTPISGVV